MNFKNIYIIIFLFVIHSQYFAQTVIVNSSNPITSLSKAAVRNIFLGNTSTWENRNQIIIVDYVAENDLRKKFSDVFLNLSPKRVSMIWIKASLSGKTVPPKVFHTETEILKYIAENEGAIGYLAKAVDLPPNVKTIQVQ